MTMITITIDNLVAALIEAKKRGVKNVVATWTFVDSAQLADWDSLNYKEQRIITALLTMKNFAATQHEIQKQLRVKKPASSHPGVWRVLRRLEHTHKLINSYQTTNASDHKNVYFLTPDAVLAYRNKKITATKPTPTTKNPVW